MKRENDGGLIPIACPKADTHRLWGEIYGALKKLRLKDNNFVLIHDLNNAMLKAGPELLWNEIESELKSEIPDFPAEDVSIYGRSRSYQLSEATWIKVSHVSGRI